MTVEDVARRSDVSTAAASRAVGGTNFVQPIVEMARRAAELLLDAIERRDSQPARRAVPTVTQLPGWFAARGSTVLAATTSHGERSVWGRPAPHSNPIPVGAR